VNTKFKRILFDYDGTLIIHDKQTEGEIIANLLNIPKEKVPYFVKRLNYLFEISYGREFYANRKMTYSLFYNILEYIINPVQNFGVSVKELDDAINYKSIHMTDLAPNAKETVEYLYEKGYELCVFTNGFYKPQSINMKVHGIHDYFEKIYAWDNWYAKPDKRALRRVLGETSPKENIMIGDSLTSDIIPAKKQGVYTIGYNVKKLEEATILPDLVITDLLQLTKIL